jgi:TatD DNase family protein
MFTDTHCHIYSEYYNNIDSVINESVDNKVNRWINNGCDRESNKEVLSLIDKYNNMYGAIGIHPENVLDYTSSDLKSIEENLNNKKRLASGEIG